VIITSIIPGGAADNVGLSEGDIIFRVGNTPVNNPQEFDSLVKETAKEGEVLFLVRDGKTGRVGYIVVPLN
jgi:S1-C subfamily serine protease